MGYHTTLPSCHSVGYTMGKGACDGGGGDCGNCDCNCGNCNCGDCNCGDCNCVCPDFNGCCESCLHCCSDCCEAWQECDCFCHHHQYYGSSNCCPNNRCPHTTTRRSVGGASTGSSTKGKKTFCWERCTQTQKCIVLMIFCGCCFAVLALAGAYVLNAHANSSGCVRCSSNSGGHTSSSNTTAVTVVQRLTQVTTTITTATTTIITMSDGSTNSQTSSTTRTTNHTIKPLSSTNLDPVPCGGGEKRYHSWMSMGYAFITAIGLLLGLTSRMKEVKKNDRMVVNMEFQFVVLVCIPGPAFLIFSGSFLSSCSSQDLTMYMPRSITFGTLGTLLLILAAGLQFP